MAKPAEVGLVLLQTVAQWVEQSLPYLGILGAVFLYHHCAGEQT
jgi:hypothetical protein